MIIVEKLAGNQSSETPLEYTIKICAKMNRSDVQTELVSSVGSMLSNAQDGKFRKSADFGNFFCSIENFDGLTVIEQDFETGCDPITIPFSCHEPVVQMIFSLDGESFFNDHSDPFSLSWLSHSLNFFNSYECKNLLGENAHQHDITFGLKKSFYADLITNQLALSEDRLSSMIFHQQQFNTINEHIPADPAILGILKNILNCPFKGEMKSTFIREHVRALLMLQLFHFSPIVTGKKIQQDSSVNRRDADVLHDVKKYIDEHFLDPTSIEMLSKHFGINEFKLKHGFKELFNTSPIRYLQYKRLTYSLQLLRDTDKTIKQIADEIGYAHGANFTVAFTKTFGKSPLQYRS
jgi:AraC-like DNA-binding protein